VLTSNATLQAMVVPQGPAQPAETNEPATGTEHKADQLQGRPGHIG
jgi:hypothetical protein